MCRQQGAIKNTHIETVSVEVLSDHEFQSVGDPLGDADGADHHLGLQLPLLRPVILHSNQNPDLG